LSSTNNENESGNWTEKNKRKETYEFHIENQNKYDTMRKKHLDLCVYDIRIYPLQPYCADSLSAHKWYRKVSRKIEDLLPVPII